MILSDLIHLLTLYEIIFRRYISIIDQLQEIRKVTLARILCSNLNVKVMREAVFQSNSQWFEYYYFFNIFYINNYILSSVTITLYQEHEFFVLWQSIVSD